nr:hypothetical protein [Tanacetum cinerariifolium]
MKQLIVSLSQGVSSNALIRWSTPYTKRRAGEDEHRGAMRPNTQVSDVVGFFHPRELTGPFISLHEQFRGGLFKSLVMGGGARVVQVALRIGEAIEHE